MRAIWIATAFAAVVPPAVWPQSTYILHSFPNDGTGNPYSALTETAPGVFMGESLGTLFEITGAGGFKDLYSFGGSAVGQSAEGTLFPASNGYLFGVTGTGGASGGGTVFQTTLAGAVTVASADVFLSSPVAEASDGNIYGITDGTGGNYSFFRLAPGGTLTILYTLGRDGSGWGPLLEASDGNFYGATAPVSGVAGIVYRLTPSGEFRVLHTFAVGQGGSGGLTQATNGLLYGSLTSDCTNDQALGIYSISLSGSYSLVHSFEVCSTGLGNPKSGLIEASDGNLYGTVAAGLSFGDGGLFRMTLEGGDYEVLFIFDGSDGLSPDSEGPGVVQGSDGSIYGTASGGGPDGGGVVYRWVGGLAPPLPAVKLFQPSAGAPGSAVRITGAHLVGLSGVSFNGIAAQFTSRGDRYAYAVVPQGATSGPITVTTMNGSGTSKTSFTVE